MIVTLLAAALADPALVAQAPRATAPPRTWKTAVEADAALIGVGGVLAGVGGIVMAQAAVTAAVIEGQIQQDEALDNEGYAEHEGQWAAARTRWKVGAGLAGAGVGAAGAGLVLRFGKGS